MTFTFRALRLAAFWLAPLLVSASIPVLQGCGGGGSACCKTCSTGKACGDSCIPSTRRAHKPAGAHVTVEKSQQNVRFNNSIEIPVTKTILAFTALTMLSLVTTSESYAKGGSRGGPHASSSRSSSHGTSHSVRGYTKKNGTYVAPHRKTSPDKAKSNNYDSKGNVNPNTGKEGTKDPSRP